VNARARRYKQQTLVAIEAGATMAREPLRVFVAGWIFGNDALGGFLAVFVYYLLSVPITNFGLGEVMARLLRGVAHQDREAFGLIFAVRTAITVGVVLIAVPAGIVVLRTAGFAGTEAVIWVLAAASIVNIGPVFGAAARHLGRNEIGALIAVSTTTMGLVALLLLSRASIAPNMAMSLAVLIESVLGAAISLAAFRPARPSRRRVGKQLKPLFRYCTVITLGSLSSNFYRQIDLLLMSWFAAPVEVGAYALLSRIASASSVPSHVYATAIRRNLTDRCGQPDPTAIIRSVRSLGQLSQVVLLALLMFLPFGVLFLPPIEGAHLYTLGICLLATLLQTANLVGGWTVQIVRRPVALVWGAFLASVVGLLVGWICVPWLGALGAALVSVVANLCAVIPILLMSRNLQPLGRGVVTGFFAIDWLWRRGGSSIPDESGTAGEPWQPDFICIGGIRCGSTWIQSIMVGHPDASVPIEKETEYFSRYYFNGPTWYRSRFPARLARVVGEVCPQYMHSASALRHIVLDCPCARFVVSLRDPVDRAYSHFLMDCRDRGGSSGRWSEAFDAAVREPGNKYLEFSKYARQLRPFIEAVGRERIHFVRFSDVQDRPEDVVRGICRFLGIDEQRVRMSSGAVNQAAEYRSFAVFRLSRLIADTLRRWNLGLLIQLLRRTGLLFVLRRWIERPIRFPPVPASTRAFVESQLEGDAKELEYLLGPGCHW
jgi:O-antigen/teichoic acid export membrane protein